MSSQGTILFWFDVVRNLALLVLGLIWLASIVWVVRDARERGVNAFAAFLLALALPFVGAFVYALVRPGVRVAERRERELWLKLAERGMRAKYCLACGTQVERDFVACPSCGETLRRRCAGCGSALELAWAICPYCGEREDERRVWTEQEPARAAVAEVTPLEPLKRPRKPRRTAASKTESTL